MMNPRARVAFWCFQGMDPWASAALSVAATRARARLDCDDELEDKDKIDDAFKR